MVRQLLAVAALLTALCASDAAIAGTMTYSSYQLQYGQTLALNIWYPPIGNAVGAGAIQLNGINGTNQSLTTYCIDINHELLNMGSFTTGTNTLSADVNMTINALISNATPTFTSNANAAAALQLAIWETIYTPSIAAYINTSAITNLASLDLQYVANGTWKADLSRQVMMLDGGGITQSQVYLTPPQTSGAKAVPEPASLAIIGAGLVGAAAVWRRRSRVGS